MSEQMAPRKPTKIYFEGTEDGKAIKIGRTNQPTEKRRAQRTNGYYGRPEYLLAAVQSDASSETHLKKHFKHLLAEQPGQTEYHNAEPELVEYVNWLRDQYFTWLWDGDDGPDDVMGYEAFCPTLDRRRPLPPSVGALYEEWDCREPMPLTTDLRGTPWAAMSVAKPVYNDYYTPPWMIKLAWEGMGGIDLDPASHWSANRVHKIPRFYSRQHDAHTRPWNGRVWLNAPYGDNKPWIDDIVTHWDSGAVTQLCWLAPAYAFNKRQAAPVMQRAALAILLTDPTDTMFWGWGKATEIRPQKFCGPDHPALGVNQPHLIVYLGDRAEHLASCFESADKGIALRPMSQG